MKIPLCIGSVFSCFIASSGNGIFTRRRNILGPAGCATLSISEQGTCVITTDCEGQEISKTEFAFDCAGVHGAIVRHSFGTGGFDSSEEFDTDVKCSQCYAPSADDVLEPAQKAAAPTKQLSQPLTRQQKRQKPATQQKNQQPQKRQQVAGKAAAQSVNFKLASQVARNATPLESVVVEDVEKVVEDVEDLGHSIPAQQQAAQAPTQVYFGPKKCVSTYKSTEGSCVMQTQCQPQDIEGYTFGLVCVDKTGFPVRHLFGVSSFEAVETFDTLIPCERCIGLNDVPMDVALTGQVTELVSEMDSLKSYMTNLTGEVSQISAIVFKPKPPPGLTPAKDAYDYYHQGCIASQDIENIGLYQGKSVDECATICDGLSNCTGFEYGVDYGGQEGEYNAQDCQPNSGSYSAQDAEDCDGASWNLDFYMKHPVETTEDGSDESDVETTDEEDKPDVQEQQKQQGRQHRALAQRRKHYQTHRVQRQEDQEGQDEEQDEEAPRRHLRGPRRANTVSMKVEESDDVASDDGGADVDEEQDVQGEVDDVQTDSEAETTASVSQGESTDGADADADAAADTAVTDSKIESAEGADEDAEADEDVADQDSGSD